MLWHIRLVRISPGLWVCRSHSISWKLDFCQLCSMLFTACCLITVGWIEANRVSSLPFLFCPLTVKLECVKKLHSICSDPECGERGGVGREDCTPLMVDLRQCFYPALLAPLQWISLSRPVSSIIHWWLIHLPNLYSTSCSQNTA